MQTKIKDKVSINQVVEIKKIIKIKKKGINYD
jgi:hypothetical protein